MCQSSNRGEDGGMCSPTRAFRVSRISRGAVRHVDIAPSGAPRMTRSRSLVNLHRGDRCFRPDAPGVMPGGEVPCDCRDTERCGEEETS
jgi:hypothetical protein